MRYQRGTSVVDYNAKRNAANITSSGAGEFQGCWCVAIKVAIEGVGGAMSKRERLRRAKKKDSIYPIGDGENKKARSLAQKKGSTMGLEPTWV
jgi:hypothetical protein